MHKNKTQLYDSLKKIERKKLTFETMSGCVLGILVWQNYNYEDPYHKFEQLYKFSRVEYLGEKMDVKQF